VAVALLLPLNNLIAAREIIGIIFFFRCRHPFG